LNELGIVMAKVERKFEGWSALCPHCFVRMGYYRLRKHRPTCHMISDKETKDGK